MGDKQLLWICPDPSSPSKKQIQAILKRHKIVPIEVQTSVVPKPDEGFGKVIGVLYSISLSNEENIVKPWKRLKALGLDLNRVGPVIFHLSKGDAINNDVQTKLAQTTKGVAQPPTIISFEDNVGLEKSILYLLSNNKTQHTIPMVKVAANIEKAIQSDIYHVTVLVLSGSLSPVHRMHIESFELAKKRLQTMNIYVAGGYIAPSSEQYVRSKLGKEAINLFHRNKLCDLAVEDSDWLEVCDWGLASSPAIRDRIKTILT